MNPPKHNYAAVIEWDEKRTIEISGMLKPYLAVTDAYAGLICEKVDVIGTEKPGSTQDIVVRDFWLMFLTPSSRRVGSYSLASAARLIRWPAGSMNRCP